MGHCGREGGVTLLLPKGVSNKVIHFPLICLSFVLRASALIWKVEVEGSLHGVKVCIGASNVSHILFANDCFIFFRASMEEYNVMKGILTV